ncbi:MAG TPA: stage V sporulation protein T [Candidatus Merdenecus merdavium]|nr:stage V sporulation protein T [Candidatus Merdenecus merdavium]
MKATGIVRRIDDLGRVVIPKEIRRTLRIREGDPLEIFTDREGEIILKKYSPIGELSAFAKEYAESLALSSGHIACITDRDQIIAVAGGSKKDFMGKFISKELEHTINERENILAMPGEKSYVRIINDEIEAYPQAITPIICQGDAIGSVALLGKNLKVPMTELEQKLITCAAMFLGRQMEQ